MATKTGRCMCGAVGFSAEDVPMRYGICHCEMCRRWTGSALLGVSVPTERVTWHGREHIATLQSSEWAERAWCGKCGTGLYYRVTERGKWFGATEIPIGLFDDANGFALENEIYTDMKPDSYAYTGEGHKRLTRAECLELFSRDIESGTEGTEE